MTHATTKTTAGSAAKGIKKVEAVAAKIDALLQRLPEECGDEEIDSLFANIATAVNMIRQRASENTCRPDAGEEYLP